MFTNFFTTYEATEAPPVVTEEARKIKENYDWLLKTYMPFDMTSYNNVFRDQPSLIQTDNYLDTPISNQTIGTDNITFSNIFTKSSNPFYTRQQSNSQDIHKQNLPKVDTSKTSAKKPNSFGKFNNSKDFIVALNNAYRKGLQEAGLDPNFSLMLVAQDAIETDYGRQVKGNFNYGNITIDKGDPWHYQTSIGLKMKDYKSIEDYVKGKISFLQRKRYKFFEKNPTPNNIIQAMQRLADDGYCPGCKGYGSSIQSTYNSIVKKLNV